MFKLIFFFFNDLTIYLCQHFAIDNMILLEVCSYLLCFFSQIVIKAKYEKYVDFLRLLIKILASLKYNNY